MMRVDVGERAVDRRAGFVGSICEETECERGDGIKLRGVGWVVC